MRGSQRTVGGARGSAQTLRQRVAGAAAAATDLPSHNHRSPTIWHLRTLSLLHNCSPAGKDPDDQTQQLQWGACHLILVCAGCRGSLERPLLICMHACKRPAVLWQSVTSPHQTNIWLTAGESRQCGTALRHGGRMTAGLRNAQPPPVLPLQHRPNLERRPRRRSGRTAADRGHHPPAQRRQRLTETAASQVVQAAGVQTPHAWRRVRQPARAVWRRLHSSSACNLSREHLHQHNLLPTLHQAGLSSRQDSHHRTCSWCLA